MKCTDAHSALVVQNPQPSKKNLLSNSGWETPEESALLALLSPQWDSLSLTGRLKHLEDWDFLLTLMKRHRVFSLCADRLLSVLSASPGIVPDRVSPLLHNRLRANMLTGMRQISEARKLSALLADKGISCVILKGAPVSAMAFGNPTLRDARDIDILIDIRNLDEAEACLTGAGLSLEKPTFRSPFTRTLFRRYSHEYLFKTPTGILVELKTRLHPTESLTPLRTAEALGRRQSVRILDQTLPVLAADDLLMYLCSHGARHCWFRLKWLADIAALVAQIPEHTLLDQLEAARRTGSEVPLLEGLLLSRDWLECPLPPAIENAARAHPLVTQRRPLLEPIVQNSDPHPFNDRNLQDACDKAERLLRADHRYRITVLERHLMVRLRSGILSRHAP